MAIIFDGRAFAARKERELKLKIDGLRKKGMIPKLVSILVGNDPASRLYVSLKKKRGEEIGAEVKVQEFSSKTSAKKIIQTIEELSNDKTVQGIMVQLPLPGDLEKETDKIIKTISPAKDVDGLRDDSPFVHPTAMAVLQIIEEARLRLASARLDRTGQARQAKTICVIGKKGMVGSSLLKEIKKTSLQLIKESKKADILVSATGSPRTIKIEMIKKGAIVVDVGSPRGDVDSKATQVAGFLTPVPGGVGPVTISCLLENLIEASSITT